MPERSSALLGRKVAVGATRAGGGTGSGQSRGNPLRSPPQRGVCRRHGCLLLRSLPYLSLEDSSHFAWLGVSVACGSNGPDARRPSPSWTSCSPGSGSARSSDDALPQAKDSRRRLAARTGDATSAAGSGQEARPGLSARPSVCCSTNKPLLVIGHLMVHVWSTIQRNRAVCSGLQQCALVQVADVILGNRTGCRALIRMRSLAAWKRSCRARPIVAVPGRRGTGDAARRRRPDGTAGGWPCHWVCHRDEPRATGTTRHRVSSAPRVRQGQPSQGHQESTR
jgi:hypothetical protein